MRDKRRLDEIKKIKVGILKELDKIGTSEVSFDQLLGKLNKKFNEKVLKKYVGICFDDGLVDINTNIFKSRSNIKSSINKNTKIQILSEGQKYAYGGREIETEKEFNFPILKWFGFKYKRKIKRKD